MTDSAPSAARVKPPTPAATKPKGDKSTSSTKQPSGKPPGRQTALEKQLEEFFMGTALIVSVAVDEFDGKVIRDNAESLAKQWNKVAQQNATVRRILTSMMEAGAWSGAITATAAVVVPIAQHHGALPATLPTPFVQSPKVKEELKTKAQEMTKQPPQTGSPITPSQSKPGT
jgi:hypothetical protein